MTEKFLTVGGHMNLKVEHWGQCFASHFISVKSIKMCPGPTLVNKAKETNQMNEWMLWCYTL